MPNDLIKIQKNFEIKTNNEILIDAIIQNSRFFYLKEVKQLLKNNNLLVKDELDLLKLDFRKYITIKILNNLKYLICNKFLIQEGKDFEFMSYLDSMIMMGTKIDNRDNLLFLYWNKEAIYLLKIINPYKIIYIINHDENKLIDSKEKIEKYIDCNDLDFKENFIKKLLDFKKQRENINLDILRSIDIFPGKKDFLANEI